MFKPRKGYEYTKRNGKHVVVGPSWYWASGKGTKKPSKPSIRRCRECGADIEIVRNRRGGWAQFDKGLSKYGVLHACSTRGRNLGKRRGRAIRDLFEVPVKDSDTALPKQSSSKDKPMIQPTPVFKDNLALLPAIDGLARIELLEEGGAVVATIENKPGKQGSLAVYQYLAQSFDALDATAAAHGVEVFGEHTEDAKNRPGAHPNIDLLLAIIAGGAPLSIRSVAE